MRLYLLIGGVVMAGVIALLWHQLGQAREEIGSLETVIEVRDGEIEAQRKAYQERQEALKAQLAQERAIAEENARAAAEAAEARERTREALSQAEANLQRAGRRGALGACWGQPMPSEVVNCTLDDCQIMEAP